AQQNGGGKERLPVEIAAAHFRLADADAAPDGADDPGRDLAIRFLPDFEILAAAGPGDGPKRVAVEHGPDRAEARGSARAGPILHGRFREQTSSGGPHADDVHD